MNLFLFQKIRFLGSNFVDLLGFQYGTFFVRKTENRVTLQAERGFATDDVLFATDNVS
jgi:hypothetical protein